VYTYGSYSKIAKIKCTAFWTTYGGGIGHRFNRLHKMSDPLIDPINCFGLRTDSISLLILFLCLFPFGRRSSKKPEAPLLQVGSGWNLAGLFLKKIRIEIGICEVTSYFQDGGHGVLQRLQFIVIISVWSSWSIVRNPLFDFMRSRRLLTTTDMWQNIAPVDRQDRQT